MSEFTLKISPTAGPAWQNAKTIQIWQRITQKSEPDFFVLVSQGGSPYVRIDVHIAEAPVRCFQDAIIWHSWVVVGYGDFVHFVSLDTHLSVMHALEGYFGGFYPGENYLLAESASGLFKFDEDAKIVWRRDDLGIDGVVVHDISNGVIRGDGEWDPPGGWEPFRIRLSTGEDIVL